MVMFNSIYPDLLCPVKKEITKRAWVQFKWQKPQARVLNVYKLGDVLKDLEPEYDNTWIRTDYICDACSQQTKGHNGQLYVKTADQKRHFIFVHVEDSRLKEILTEEQFNKRGIKGFEDDC